LCQGLVDFGPLFGTGQPLHMRLAQSPLLWGSEGFSKDFKESSESKGAHPSHSQKARTGQSQKCPPPRGTEGSNPSPSSGESAANLTSSIRRQSRSVVFLAGDRGSESFSLQQRVSCEPEDDVEAERRALAPIDFAPDCPGVHAIAGIAEQVLRLEGTWPWRARRIWPVAMSGRRTLREQDRPRLQPFASSFGAVCENGFHHEPLW
jgi:hypothetical protein